MLKHGLQNMHGSTIWAPRSADARPDSERLDRRYAEFKAAS